MYRRFLYRHILLLPEEKIVLIFLGHLFRKKSSFFA